MSNSTRYTSNDGYVFYVMDDKTILTHVKSYRSFLHSTPANIYTRAEGESEYLNEQTILEWLFKDALFVKQEILMIILQKGYSNFVFEQLKLTKVNPKFQAVNQLLSAAQFILES